MNTRFDRQGFWISRKGRDPKSEWVLHGQKAIKASYFRSILAQWNLLTESDQLRKASNKCRKTRSCNLRLEGNVINNRRRV